MPRWITVGVIACMVMAAIYGWMRKAFQGPGWSRGLRFGVVISLFFLIFCLALTLLFSSLLRSSLAAGGLALAVIVAQAGLTALPRFGDYMPGKLLGWGTNLLAGKGESYWWALVITVAVILFCVYFAQRTLRYKDL